MVGQICSPTERSQWHRLRCQKQCEFSLFTEFDNERYMYGAFATWLIDHKHTVSGFNHNSVTLGMY